MVKPATSKTTPNVLNATCPPITAPNPYARDPSRRAIACVACAKAKTRCDKALPSCARCVTKGLTCDPRSTRRTSDNNYRTLPIKKAFVAPKRFPTPGVLPSSNAFPSPRSIASSRPRAMMRAPSHIDFRTAVKMSQQAAIMSGVPKLTPLPTYQSQIVDECWDYTPSPEPELRFTPEMEQDGFPFSRGATPQTPSDPFGCHEPLPILDGMDYLDCQPWSNEGLVPVGLGFAGMDTAMAMDTWMTPTTPEPEDMVQANMFAQTSDYPSATQMQGSFDGSLSTVQEDWSGFQTSMPDELVTDANANANANANAKVMEGSMDSGIVMQGEWLHGQSSHGYVDMSNMVTSAPYVPKMQGIPNNAPMWEDVFMPSSVVY